MPIEITTDDITFPGYWFVGYFDKCIKIKFLFNDLSEYNINIDYKYIVM